MANTHSIMGMPMPMMAVSKRHADTEWISGCCRGREYRRVRTLTELGLDEPMAKWDDFEDPVVTRKHPEVCSHTDPDALSLHGRKISNSRLPELLRGQEHIEHLTLDTTSVTDDGLQSLLILQKLVLLYIKKSPITDRGLETIAKLSTLSYLSFAWCPVTDKALDQIVPLEELKGISFPYTDISNEACSDLRRFPCLTSLILNATKVTDQAMEYLAAQQLAFLRRLDIEDTPITDQGIAHLTELKSLVTVHFDGTSITDDSLKLLRCLPNLKSLTVCRTKIGDEGLKYIKDYSALKTLGVKDTNVSERGIHELRTRCPDLEVW
jgi:internalin A